MTAMHINGEAVLVKTVDSKQRFFNRFFAEKDPVAGPGWFVFGRNEAYGEKLIMNCARPNVPKRIYKNFNGRRSRGWRTKRDATAIANAINCIHGLGLAEWLAQRAGRDTETRAALQNRIEHFRYGPSLDFKSFVMTRDFAVELADALDTGYISARRAAKELDLDSGKINKFFAKYKISTRIEL